MKLIDGDALCRWLSDWQLSLADVNSKIHGSLVTYDALEVVMDMVQKMEPIPMDGNEPWRTAKQLPKLRHEAWKDDKDGTLEFDVSDKVIVYTTAGEMTTAVYTKDEVFEGWQDETGRTFDVVNWKPMPEPPKKEARHGT